MCNKSNFYNKSIRSLYIWILNKIASFASMTLLMSICIMSKIRLWRLGVKILYWSHCSLKSFKKTTRPCIFSTFNNSVNIIKAFLKHNNIFNQMSILFVRNKKNYKNLLRMKVLNKCTYASFIFWILDFSYGLIH